MEKSPQPHPSLMREAPPSHLGEPSARRQPPDVMGPDSGRGARMTVLAVVAIGGALGAAARYGSALLWPSAPTSFPWTTLLVNAVGCAVIGLFMVLITEVWSVHRLVRPFFGVGVLGGFTTFSTYVVDAQRLMDRGEPRLALGYLALTPVVALGAVWSAAVLTRRAVGLRRAAPLPTGAGVEEPAPEEGTP